jgi:hypothetical protein
MNISSLAGALFLAMGTLAFAQEALTNASIEKMEKAGLGDDVILSMIQGQPGQFDVTPDSLIALKREGISDNVLAAMAAKSSRFYEDLDVGVYRKVANRWVPVVSELVNWKTGGIAKDITSGGLVRQDLNGRISGRDSPTPMNTPLEFLIKVSEGSDATDYQLVRLHQKKDAREFRALTGGVFHASGGSMRDAVAVKQKKIAKQTYIVTLPVDLRPGQFAFLAPDFNLSTESSSANKAYTFRLVE